MVKNQCHNEGKELMLLHFHFPPTTFIGSDQLLRQK